MNHTSTASQFYCVVHFKNEAAKNDDLWLRYVRASASARWGTPPLSFHFASKGKRRETKQECWLGQIFRKRNRSLRRRVPTLPSNVKSLISVKKEKYRIPNLACSLCLKQLTFVMGSWKLMEQNPIFFPCDIPDQDFKLVF